jgi:hypothetical protein
MVKDEMSWANNMRGEREQVAILHKKLHMSHTFSVLGNICRQIFVGYMFQIKFYLSTENAKQLFLSDIHYLCSKM